MKNLKTLLLIGCLFWGGLSMAPDAKAGRPESANPAAGVVEPSSPSSGEGDYLQLLHERQTERPEPAMAGGVASEVKPAELSYLQLLHQKQSETVRQAQSGRVGEMPGAAGFMRLVGLAGLLMVAAGIGFRIRSRKD